MEIHDEVLGLGVPVPDLALVAVGVPGHALGHVSVVLVLGDQLVILVSLRARAILQGLPQDHRGLARPEMSSSYPRALSAKVSDILTAKPSLCNIFIAFSLFLLIFFISFFLLPCDGRGPGDGAVAGHGRVVLDAGHGVGRVKVVVVNAGHGRA